MDIAISSCEQGTFQGSRATFGFLRLYANGNWVDSNGQQHIGGAVDSSQYYESFPVTIDSDGIIHIPSINIQTTTDAMQNPNVRITAAVYTGNKKTHSNVLIQNAFIPVSQAPTTTWEEIREANLATQAEIGLPPTWWQLTYGLFSTLTNAAQKASRVIYGTVTTSVDPANAAAPIVVGNNDPRVNVLNADLYSSFSLAVDAAAADAVIKGEPVVLSVTTAMETNAKVIPASVTLEITNGGTLTATAGVVQVLGQLRIPPQLAFIEDGGTFNIAAAKADKFYFEWFGASITASDNTTALQKMFDRRQTSDSTSIQLMGIYQFASPLSMNRCRGVGFVGLGGEQFQPKAGLTYTGAGSSSAITIKSAFGLSFRNGIQFKYTNASFTGIYMESGHDPAADTAYCNWDGIYFTGTTSAYTCAALLQLNNTIISSIKNCTFWYAQKGIQGRKDIGDGGGYSYVTQIENCTFISCGIHIYNYDANWSIKNCTAEGNTIALGGNYRAGDCRFLDAEVGTYSYNVNVKNCQFNDVGASASTYAVVRLVYALGAHIDCNWGYLVANAGSGGRVIAIETVACQGLAITGGRYELADYFLINSSAASFGVAVTGVDVACIDNDTQTLDAVPYAGNNIFLANSNVDNVVKGSLAIRGELIPTNLFGDVDIGYKSTSLTGSNASAEIAVLDGGLGLGGGAMALFAPYTGGDNPGYLGNYTGTVRTPRLKWNEKGIGYAAGNGGTTTQATSKSTAPSALNKPSGTITMNNANLAAGAIVSFTLSNTCCEVGDAMVINHISGGTLGAYTFNAAVGANAVTIYVRNATAGDLAEAVVLKFDLTKGVNA